MLIAKIIKSNSHVDYAARVLDSLETVGAPEIADYGFAQFVKIGISADEIVGVIYNSQLINPEYGNYGPRLSTPPELNSVFSPDYLSEQGVLIGVLLLGWRDARGWRQGIPRTVLPTNSEVRTMTTDEIRAFHQDKHSTIQFAYYTHLTTHAGEFAFPLISAICDQLEMLADAGQCARLKVLRRSLAWQQTVGGIR
ncbi:MAG TPA: hypothetical protein PLD20_23100 [Blastocatellia bacterium]|nr:hypothetical protein [Blastocatellia bacterium]HMZ20841.1 hypothetical protein [Blastocatellia bacterium]HNG29043.1 hypothetical protein [Blastocatellia bacterium]